MNLKKKHKFNLLIVYPNIKCSTRKVYSKVFKYSIMSKPTINKIIKKNKFIDLIMNEKNDLQYIVEKKYPAIRKLVLKIKSFEGCYFSRMTGSGSACYGVFKSQKSAKKALNKIKLIFPNYWSALAKTI